MYNIEILRKHKIKIKFLLAGIVNTIVGIIIYPIFYIILEPFKLHYLIILVITYIISILFAFFTNKVFVFQTKGNHLSELSKFFSFHLIQLLINFAMLPIMVEYFNIPPILAQPIFAILVVISSYFWHSRITFINKK